MLITKRICVEFKRKNITSLFFSTFKLPATTKNLFMTNPLNIILVDFGR